MSIVLGTAVDTWVGLVAKMPGPDRGLSTFSPEPQYYRHCQIVKH